MFSFCYWVATACTQLVCYHELPANVIESVTNFRALGEPNSTIIGTIISNHVYNRR